METIPVHHKETYSSIFMRFLRFGFLAWGGPVAQIAMIRQELVEEKGWISRQRFNRVLSVYQVLPGPEATELCVFFGMLARGRLGGFLAGLAFMLPGFILMFALSWLYVSFGIHTPILAAVFAGFQPAVVALIVRAIHRIGQHALTHPWLWVIALTTVAAELIGISFAITLPLAGIFYVLLRKRMYLITGGVALLFLAGVWAFNTFSTDLFGVVVPDGLTPLTSAGPPSLLALFYYGLRSGLLTFGGAYTVIPFLQNDAVTVGAWMTNEQFLDGLALSGILPAPLIIFATFVGYLGAQTWGALVLTTGIFLPAFSFTLVGHNYLERIIENRALHNFLDGVTAGVVGLISATAIELLLVALDSLPAWIIFLLAVILLYRWHAKAAVAIVVVGAGVLGLLFSYMF